MGEKLPREDAELALECALDIGESMLRTGAEILRVESTIMRICQTYGDGIVDVFTILSLIIVSWHPEGGRNITQSRRIYSYETDLEKLEELNALSRYICDKKPSYAEIKEGVNEIMCRRKKRFSKSRLAGYVLVSSAFAVFFGGNLRDGLAAGLVGIVLYLWDMLFAKGSRNRVVYSLIISVVAGLACILSVAAGIGVNTDKIMIGSIMLLIPGINLMNSLRDMMSGDIITGILRLAEALMMAVAIAAGFGLAIMALGGVC
ncbi:MAG: threonine/serine exporter family protein [Roseburia sp.]|nr:threonine/serine exporter family protein [Roseburia sp.]